MRALLVGDRIDVAALERDDQLKTISTLPLAFKAGENGLVAVFRYGVVVFVGLTQPEENDVLKNLKGKISGPFKTREREDETATVEISVEREDQIPAGGPIYVRDLALETGSGDISVRAPATLAGEVEIETASGEIETDFPIQVTRHARDHVVGRIGDGVGRVAIETGSGDVRLLKSAK